ncbi:MAG: LOG family protein [Chloroflexi bacterium]|nr:LOG family protein [Chloroflexota bacterium]
MSSKTHPPAIISAFGSSLPLPGSEDYELARTIGETLAKAGFQVMSGGYGGVMAAVSQGAAAAGGHVIGITCKQIERLGERAANRYLSEEIRYDTLDERVHHLIEQADGYVICSGGLGTLHEIATVLEWMRVGKIPRRPVVCRSSFWLPLLREIMASPYIPAGDRNLIQFADSQEQMLQHLANCRL